jgi:SAM-dependent methyltransferase
MAQSDRVRWDERYTNPNKQLRKKEPSDLLIRYAPRFRPGIRALELACGLGQNALWLAGQGYRVEAIDISFQALRRARAEMLRRGLTGVQFIAADLDHFALPRYAYDLVIVFRFLDRRLFPAIRDRVRPGGTVIYQTMNIRRQGEHAGHTLQIGELPSYFPGWIVLEAADEGDQSWFAGRKPEGG